MPLRPLDRERFELQLLRTVPIFSPRQWAGQYFGEGKEELDWDSLAVGDPAIFTAFFNRNHTMLAVASGATVTCPEDLDAPGWAVRRDGRDGVPVMVGRVGRALSAGEKFVLPVLGVWV